MEEVLARTDYLIKSYLWNDLSSKSKTGLGELTKSGYENAKAFVSLYFNKYDLVHKIGHIVRIELGQHDVEAGHELEEEYLANLFAVKYFQFKKEDVYLSDLGKWIDFLLASYNIKSDIDLFSIKNEYVKYTEDIKTHAAISFVMIKQCLQNTKNLGDVVKVLSKGNLKTINTSVITRKGIIGKELINECKEIMFALYDNSVSIDLEYESELNMKEYEKIEIKRRTTAST
jgi:hypothetical protein